MSDALSIGRQYQLVLSGTGTEPKSLDDFDAAIAEILSWLPVKSLLRFRCVCKAWCALISESYFIQKHLTHAKIRSSFNLIVRTGDVIFRSTEYQALLNNLSNDGLVPGREIAFPDMNIPLEWAYIQIVGSCNGLICLLCDRWETPTLMLWNPCTRDSQVLPIPPMILHDISFSGFGYDSTIDDYKVILGVLPESGYKSVWVFTLKTGSWEKLESLSKYYDLDFDPGYLVNEALHWVFDEDKHDQSICAKMLSFDLAEEKFHEIAFPYPPNPVDRRELIAGVGILNNCLTLCFQTMYRQAGSKFKMWVMKEYGVKESWTEIISIPSEVFDDEYRYVTCISENGEVLMQRFSDSSLVLYDPKEKTFRTLLNFGCGETAATYIESLVSPLIGSMEDHEVVARPATTRTSQSKKAAKVAKKNDAAGPSSAAAVASSKKTTPAAAGVQAKSQPLKLKQMVLASKKSKGTR